MKNERWIFLALLIAFVALAFAYSVTIPLGEAADEVTHFAYAQYLVSHQRLPSAVGVVLGESQQPPLYYMLGAIATAWIPQSDSRVIANPDFVLGDPQTPNLLLHTRREAFPYHDTALAWHLVRWLSILMGAVTVWATWQIARIIFPDDAWITLVSATCIAFLPGFLLISAVVNNDNLVIMLTSLSILQIIRMTRQSWRQRDALILGILLGLTLVTKVSGLVAWGYAMMAFGFHAFTTREWKKVLLSFALCFGAAGAIFSPWALYNQITFGDPFAWSVYLSIASVRTIPAGWHDWVDIAGALFTSFWGRFGGALDLRMPQAFYLALGGLSSAGFLGWLGYAYDAIRLRLAAQVRVLLVLFSAFWLILLTAYARWSAGDLAAGQARLLFPGLPLFAIVFTAGIARLVAAHKRIALGVLSAIFSFIALCVLVSINSIFAPPTQSVGALPSLGGLTVSADFGGTIRVIDHSVVPANAKPGDTVSVNFYWQAIDSPTTDYWLLLQLIAKNRVVANQDGVPAFGTLTTDWWHPGQVFVSRHSITIPKDALPGNYTLRLGLHPFGNWNWLQVDGQDMLELGRIEIN